MGLATCTMRLRRRSGRSTTGSSCSDAPARRSTCPSITSSRAAIRTSWRSRWSTAFAPTMSPSWPARARSGSAPWGELLTTAAKARDAAGCVTDGLVRDVRLIREMRFPVFSGGIGPLDSKGRGVVMAIGVPVECGGVPTRPGDWIFRRHRRRRGHPGRACGKDDRARAEEGAGREHGARRTRRRRAARHRLRPPRDFVDGEG